MVGRLLDALTIHVVPMLNPDGAARFQRRNVQGIDINRDALLLQTPEGQLLKGLRDRLSPRIGFNLHNQSWRTSVGRPPKPASISLALAGCTGSDVVSILLKKRVKLIDFEINITAEQTEEHPKVFSKIDLEYVFTGKEIKPSDVERAIELSTETYCGVSAMLKKAMPINHTYRIVEC